MIFRLNLHPSQAPYIVLQCGISKFTATLLVSSAHVSTTILKLLSQLQHTDFGILQATVPFLSTYITLDV
jgi:hypothetical protein